MVSYYYHVQMIIFLFLIVIKSEKLSLNDLFSSFKLTYYYYININFDGLIVDVEQLIILLENNN